MFCLSKNTGAQHAEWLLRCSLAVMLLFLGINKFMMGIGNFVDYVAPTFEQSFLPMIITTSFLGILAYLEILLAIWLFSGWKRDLALGVTGRFMVILLFGHILQNDAVSLGRVMVYIFIIAFTLTLPQFQLSKCDK